MMGQALQHVRPTTRDEMAAAMDLAFRSGDLQGTDRAAKRLLTIDPRHAGARLLRGVIAWRGGDIERGLEQARRATECDPTNLEAWRVYARQATEADRFDEAERAHLAALDLAPGISTEMDYALFLLLVGRWSEGWARYEKRLPIERTKPKGFAAELDRKPRPMWDGKPVDRLLVLAEGGFGDIIQFARFLRWHDVPRGTTFKVPRAVGRLLRSIRYGIEIDDGPADSYPAFDAWCFAMSLPHIFRMTAEFHCGAPYLSIGASGMTPIDTGAGKPRVGLVWGGSPLAPRDGLRSLSPGHVADLVAACPQIEWHILQQGPHLAAVPALWKILRGRAEPPIEYGDIVKDFADTASIAAQLDLVVTVDTSMVHLCGATGIEAWTMLSTTPDFRYGHGTDRSPWYSTGRLFRQPLPGRWDLVVRDVAAALRERFPWG